MSLTDPLLAMFNAIEGQERTSYSWDIIISIAIYMCMYMHEFLYYHRHLATTMHQLCM